MSETAARKAAALLAGMTLAEKVQQLTSVEPYGLMNVDLPTREQEARVDYLPYNASKIAVLHIMWSMAKILGPAGISVNAVNPGPVNTPMWAQLAEQSAGAQAARDARAAQLPMRRFAEPEEVASAIAFLTDRSNRYITGVSLDVAGGAHLGMGS